MAKEAKKKKIDVVTKEAVAPKTEAKAADGQEARASSVPEDASKPAQTYRKNRYGMAVPEGFDVNSSGVYVHRFIRGTVIREQICPRLEVKQFGYFSRRRDESDPALLVAFTAGDPENEREEEYILKMSEIAGDDKNWTKELAKKDFSFAGSYRKEVERYLVASKNIAENRRNPVFFASQPGWVEGRIGIAYALPGAVYGEKDGIVPAIANVNDDYRQQGTLEEWQEKVAALAEGNPLLEFSTIIPFKSVLNRPFGCQNGTIFHLVGDSSVGKTAALRLAQSVLGRGGSYRSWKATENGPEALMEFFNDSTCVMDEWGQVNKKFRGDLGQIIYDCANGTGKTRMTVNLTQQAVKKWTTDILSSGEKTSEEAIRLTGGTITAGEMVRMPNIFAAKDLIRNLHGRKTSKALVKLIEKRTERYYGVALPAFLERILADGGKMLKEAVEAELDQKYAEELLRNHPDADTQVMRVADEFGRAMIVAKMAYDLGVMKFDCSDGVREAFEIYVNALDSVENSEESGIVSKIAAYVQRHRFWNFMPLDYVDGNLRAVDGRIVNDCCGFKYEPKGWYFFYTNFFYKTLLRGRRRKDIDAVLQEKGLLVSKQTTSYGVKNTHATVCIKMPDVKIEAPQADTLQEAVDPDTGEVTMVSKPSAEVTARAS